VIKKNGSVAEDKQHRGVANSATICIQYIYTAAQYFKQIFFTELRYDAHRTTPGAPPLEWIG
jgi:hypothetical protein